MLLTVVGSLVLAGWVCIVLYHFVLSILSWMTNRHEAPLIFPRHHFAVLIPAENAESEIGRTMDRLLEAIRYPRSMFDIIVIPVECTDRTTTVARQKDAIVYGPGKRKWRDRNDAVASVLERLVTKRRYDAYVILDVSVGVSPGFLAVLSDKLSKGAQIIQSGYRLAGPISSWRAGMAACLRSFSPSLHALWLSRYGLAVGLRRIGVCLSRSLVERYGVRSPAWTDGVSYTTRLLVDNVAVTFAPQAVVTERVKPFPSLSRAFGRQGVSRWRLIRRHAVPLLREGLQWRSAAQVLGGLNLLIPPFAWMFAGSLMLGAFAAVAHGAYSGALSDRWVVGWGLVIVAQVMLAMNRLARTHAPALAYLTLPSVPAYLAWCSGRSWLHALIHGPEQAPQPVAAPEKRVSKRRGPRRRRRARRPSSG